MKRLSKYSDFSNKQNINPNILLPTTEQPPHQNSRNYPKVSCFGALSEDSQSKNWRKRILTISDREKALNTKLLKMMTGRNTPAKVDKVLTEAASNTKHSQKILGNTLRRYLYENSNQNITFTENVANQLIQQLHKTTQQIVGTQIVIYNPSNPQEVIGSVIEALKQYRDGLRQKQNKPEIITQLTNQT